MTNTPALAHDAQVPLWPAGAPGALGDRLSDIPALTVHLPPAGTANGTAVIVNPGGGYRILASDHEGLQVARWLNRLGIAAFVLRYRLGERYVITYGNQFTPASILENLPRTARAIRTDHTAPTCHCLNKHCR